MWKTEGTGLPSQGNEIWISQFHVTLAELDSSILPTTSLTHSSQYTIVTIRLKLSLFVIKKLKKWIVPKFIWRQNQKMPKYHKPIFA